MNVVILNNESSEFSFRYIMCSLEDGVKSTAKGIYSFIVHMTAITTELITKAFIFKFVEVDNYASAYRIAV